MSRSTPSPSRSSSTCTSSTHRREPAGDHPPWWTPCGRRRRRGRERRSTVFGRFGLRAQVGEGSVAVVRTSDARLVAAALTALDGWAAEVHLAGPGVELDLASSITLDDSVLASVAGAPPATACGRPTSWVVYTSGTTGQPKPITHTFETLSRTVARSGHAGLSRWGLLYDPTRMAGLQVLLQGLLTGAVVVAPRLDIPIGERIAELAAHDVDALSATPTLWRLILQLPAPTLDLRQITLGGEIADQKVLDALAARFPEARVVHVFASTETGAAFSVRDGREGFPVSYLTDAPRGIRLEIRDGILHVYSPGVSTTDQSGFASTGDTVEVVGDRVVFRGRQSGVVNVGGTNVWPEQVERLIRAHPEVDDAVVTPKANPLSGNLLIATIVPDPTADRAGLSKRVRAWVKEQAPAAQVPAIVKLVDGLDVAGSGKVIR